MQQVNQIVTTSHLDNITAFIAERTTMRGDFRADDEAGDVGLKVDGKVEGTITIPKGGVVHIGPTGVVNGKAGDASAPAIEADLIYVEGTVEGHIVARVGLELAPTATIKGKVTYHEGLAVHHLAKLRASVTFAGGDQDA